MVEEEAEGGPGGVETCGRGGVALGAGMVEASPGGEGAAGGVGGLLSLGTGEEGRGVVAWAIGHGGLVKDVREGAIEGWGVGEAIAG